MQVLADAAAIDRAYEAGKDVRPLCGLTFAVKDNIDVAGYPTGADTPALQGAAHTCQARCSRNWGLDRLVRLLFAVCS